jgi:hypothetical protein
MVYCEGAGEEEEVKMKGFSRRQFLAGSSAIAAVAVLPLPAAAEPAIRFSGCNDYLPRGMQISLDPFRISVTSPPGSPLEVYEAWQFDRPLTEAERAYLKGYVTGRYGEDGDLREGWPASIA